ncbi:hypothetical protein HCB96_05840 [Streptococcus suis]|nr:hypothetical protein [Streptococcus suis]MCK3997787.1 hypothetical protein [Streptococcus suis]HEM4407749.1 hypothetical protein [Streptococcus suis]
MDLKQLAKRKLKEFPRWCRVAVLHHDQIQIGDDWTVKLFEFDPEDYKGRIYDWQRKAPEEVNEIIKAVNAIARPRHRAVLIMSYILPEKIQSAEQAQRLAIKSSTYYLAKNKALEEFASQYRSGILERYRGG